MATEEAKVEGVQLLQAIDGLTAVAHHGHIVSRSPGESPGEIGKSARRRLRIVELGGENLPVETRLFLELNILLIDVEEFRAFLHQQRVGID